jgi:hypothetical protein
VPLPCEESCHGKEKRPQKKDCSDKNCIGKTEYFEANRSPGDRWSKIGSDESGRA